MVLRRCQDQGHALAHGGGEILRPARERDQDGLPQPQLLVQLDQVKRDLAAKVQPLVEELIRLEVPLENEMLRALIAQPESFFLPRVALTGKVVCPRQVACHGLGHNLRISLVSTSAWEKREIAAYYKYIAY